MFFGAVGLLVGPHKQWEAVSLGSHFNECFVLICSILKTNSFMNELKDIND